VNIYDENNNKITEFDDGKGIVLYYQLPNGMDVDEFLPYAIGNEPLENYSVGTEEIDGLTYLTLKTNVLNDVWFDKVQDIAKEELEDYKDPADYRKAQRQELEAIVDEARNAIDGASSRG